MSSRQYHTHMCLFHFTSPLFYFFYINMCAHTHKSLCCYCCFLTKFISIPTTAKNERIVIRRKYHAMWLLCNAYVYRSGFSYSVREFYANSRGSQENESADPSLFSLSIELHKHKLTSKSIALSTSSSCCEKKYYWKKRWFWGSFEMGFWM